MSSGEVLSGVKFDENLIGPQSSLYVKPLRMHFVRNNPKLNQSIKLSWDMALQQDSVAVLLYDKTLKQIILVKQFRPAVFVLCCIYSAVFVQQVRQKSENYGKPLNSIEWTKYPVSMGETAELCAGLMDKNKSPLETIKEEILEECGYKVRPENIEFLKTYLTGVGISGSSQHLFYCEVDDSVKATEGGGVRTEGEFIEKVVLSVDEAKKFIEGTDISSPPSLLFAISWFLKHKKFE